MSSSSGTIVRGQDRGAHHPMRMQHCQNENLASLWQRCQEKTAYVCSMNNSKLYKGAMSLTAEHAIQLCANTFPADLLHQGFSHLQGSSSISIGVNRKGCVIVKHEDVIMHDSVQPVVSCKQALHIKMQNHALFGIGYSWGSGVSGSLNVQTHRRSFWKSTSSRNQDQL